MKTFEQDFKTNPSFNTVTGLTNTTFDPENYVTNRGATEGQIKIVHDMIKALQDWLDEFGCSDDPYEQIKQKVDELEAAIDQCCGNDQDIVIQLLNERVAAVEAAVDECCTNYESRIQEVIDNIIAIKEGDDGDTQRFIGTECNEGAVDVDYETFDFTNVNYNLEHHYSSKISKINYNINVNDGRTVYRCLFTFAKSDGTYYTGKHSNIKTYLNGFRLEGHENILITIRNNIASWRPDYGYIEITNGGSGYENGQFPQNEDYACGGLVVGPNKTYSRVFAVIMDTKGCVWEKEIPLSEFDFSTINYNLITHWKCPSGSDIEHVHVI